MVVNSCREYLEGRMRLKRVWKLVPQAGKKKNKLVDLGSFTRRRLMVDSVSPAKTWEG